MYRDLSAFFNLARVWRTATSAAKTPAWTECCTNGRCNSCK